MNVQTTPLVPMPGPGLSSFNIGTIILGLAILILLIGVRLCNYWQ